MLRYLVLLMLAISAGSTSAVSRIPGGPSPGIWWNQNESGRGLQIEMQDNIMVITAFSYLPTGAAVWYSSAGFYNHTTGEFNGQLNSASDGQCFGCAYRPFVPLPNAGGPVRIVFDSFSSGTLYFSGGSTRIVRQIYGYGDELSMARGEFVFSINLSGRVDGDWLVMKTFETSSNGSRFVGGHFEGYPTTRLAVANFDAATRKLAFLVRIGSFYDFYVVGGDDKRLVGLAWVYPTTGSPTGGGSPTQGIRIQQPTEVGAETSAQPAVGNKVSQDNERIGQESRHAIWLGQSADATPVPEFAARMARELQRQLED